MKFHVIYQLTLFVRNTFIIDQCNSKILVLSGAGPDVSSDHTCGGHWWVGDRVNISWAQLKIKSLSPVSRGFGSVR